METLVYISGPDEDDIYLDVDHAVKGPDYIHAYNSSGELIIAFEGISNFDRFDYSGTYLSPDECLNENCNDVKHCNGGFYKRDGTPVPLTPKAGFIYPLAMDTVPDGFLLCDGAAYSVEDYPELYEAIGNTYGGVSGDTFCVPDLRTRVPVGAGTGYGIGSTGGEEKHTLTAEEMPSHAHSERSRVTGHPSWEEDTLPAFTTHVPFENGTGHYLGAPKTTTAATVSSNATTFPAGGGKSHNNMQPYTVVNYIIATGKGDGGTGYVVGRSVSSGGGSTDVINDAVTSTSTTWSSKKISSEFDKRVGDIDSALDSIIALQIELMGGAE